MRCTMDHTIKYGLRCKTIMNCLHLRVEIFTLYFDLFIRFYFFFLFAHEGGGGGRGRKMSIRGLFVFVRCRAHSLYWMALPSDSHGLSCR